LSGVNLATAYVALKVDGRDVASGVKRAFGAAAVVGGIKKSIGLAMGFDKTMRQIGVQTDMSGKKLQGLSKLALKMGKDTVFSAQDASGAMLELAKGGLTAAQIKSGGLQQTLTLAAAGGLELAAAASYVTQGMNTFGIKAKNASVITTALAGGANASTASVESLGMALSQAGAGATNAGMTINETVAALAAFDNAGIKGSDAGTSLKTMLASLVPATDKARTAMEKYGLDFVKRNGQFKSMAQVAQELKTGLGGLGEAERSAALKTIFGSDATRAATVLMKEGAKGVNGYIKATKNQSKTQQMANSAMEGASGAWENFTGGAETAAIMLGTKLLPGVITALNAGSDFIAEAMTWGPGLTSAFGPTVELGADLVMALKPLVSLAGSLASGFGQLPGPVKSFVVQGAIAALIFPRLAAGAASAGTSMMVAATRTIGFGQALMTTGTRAAAVSGMMTRLGGAARMAGGVGGMLALSAATTTTSNSLRFFGSTAGGALLGLSLGGPVGAVIGGATGAIYGLATATDNAAVTMVKAKDYTKAYADTLDQLTGATTRATRARVYDRLMGDKTNASLIKSASSAGIATRDVVGAVMGQKGAWDRLNATRNQAQQQYDGLANKESAQARALAKTIGVIDLLIPSLEQERDGLDKAAAAARRRAAATATYGQALKGLKTDVAVAIRESGGKPTKAAIDRIVAAARTLSRQKIAAQIREAGGKPTKAMIDNIIARARALGLMKPRPVIGATDKATPVIRGVSSALRALHGNSATVSIVTKRYQTGGGAYATAQASGGTVLGQRRPYRDKVMTFLAPGEEVISNRYGQAERNRPLLKAINANRYADGGTAGRVAAASGSRTSEAPVPVTLHMYDVDNQLIGTMEGVADSRVYAAGALG
jgi:TP901 family phage tail tape measure protein